MSLNHQLQAKRQEIITLADRYGARNLKIFGSVARGEDQPSSDVDFLVEMDERATLLDYVGLIQDLELLLGCKVDVAEPSSLHPLIRDRVLQEAVAL
ncbi:nucleotidyltransferase family protein [bacterium]|nr:nucleotidyltransferase family protein [bacterium]